MTPLHPPADPWRRITEEARAQVRSDLKAAESTPLVYGKPIAWTECRYSRTDEITQVHRVGFPGKQGEPWTSCGEVIPPPVRWVPLSWAMIRVMARCRWCEAEQVRVARETAA